MWAVPTQALARAFMGQRMATKMQDEALALGGKIRQPSLASSDDDDVDLQGFSK